MDSPADDGAGRKAGYGSAGIETKVAGDDRGAGVGHGRGTEDRKALRRTEGGCGSLREGRIGRGRGEKRGKKEDGDK